MSLSDEERFAIWDKLLRESDRVDMTKKYAIEIESAVLAKASQQVMGDPIYQVYVTLEFRWTDCTKEQYDRYISEDYTVRKLYKQAMPAPKQEQK